MVDVILLGTGTPMGDAARCGSGTAIVDAAGWVLVDCGRGVPQRIAETGLDVSLLRAVFLTHHHSDHISDLATLATMRWCHGVRASPCRDLAKRANVRHLVLTHLLPPPQSADDEAGFVVDARRGGFGGPITVARDLLRIEGLEDQGSTRRR